jgi:hypothetical protein
MHGGVVDVATGSCKFMYRCTGAFVYRYVRHRHRHRWSYRLPVFCVAGTYKCMHTSATVAPSYREVHTGACLLSVQVHLASRQQP